MSLASTPAWVRYVDLIRNSSNELRYLFLNEQGGATAVPTTLAWTELPVVLQTGIPDRNDIHGQCLLYDINTTFFGAANDVLTVEVVDTDTIRYRKNAGSWTTVDIALEMTLSAANDMKLSFLDTTGFTASDTWTWTRTAYPYSPSEPTCLDDVPKLDMYNTDIYIGGVSRTPMRLRNEILTSIGYKRIYGRHTVIFGNHLVVSQFCEARHVAGAPTDAYNAGVTPFTIGWSDLDNPDEFWATDLNESDVYQVPTTDFPDTKSNGIMGLAKLGDLLYIYLPDAMYTMRYVGLPTVMQIDLAPFPKIGSRFANGLVVSPKGHYFIGRNDFYFFDGTSVASIGEAVRAKFFEEVGTESNNSRWNWLYAYYDVSKEEIVWCYTYRTSADPENWQTRQVIYQERDRQWYFRNVPDVRCQGRMYNERELCVYGAFNQILRDTYDNVEDVAAAIGDKSSGGAASHSFTEPSVTSHVTKYGLSRTVKEGDGQYIDASWLSPDTDIQYSYKVGKFIDPVLATGFVDVTERWTPDVKEGVLHPPKASGKTWQHRLTFKGTKVFGARLNEWGDIGLVTGAEK